MKINEPLFVLGNPRSGTSLLRLMLNAHHAITIPPECGFIEWWYVKYKDWYVQHNNDADIAAFITDLQQSKKIETWKLDYILLAQIIKEQQPVNYGHLCALVYYTFSLQQNKKPAFWGDKNNYYIHKLDVLKQIYPLGKYIMIIRDGRDVAASYRGVEKIVTASSYKPQLPQAIDAIAKEWVTNNEIILQFLKQEGAGHLIIRYEDLVIETSKELQRICSWLQIAFDENMLEYYIRNKTNEDEPAALLDWKRKTLEAPDAGKIGQYLTALSLQEIDTFEAISNNLLRSFGYDSYGI